MFILESEHYCCDLFFIYIPVQNFSALHNITFYMNAVWDKIYSCMYVPIKVTCI